MKLKSFIGGALLSAASLGAYAGDQSVGLNPAIVNSFTASSTILDGGDDVITFTGLVTGQHYRVHITVSSQNITWDQAMTNLNSATGSYFGGDLQFIDFLYNGQNPFTLTLVGGATDLTLAIGYSADVSVRAVVPEPETYAMMLGGLALVGAIARSRARKSA
jgi:hypothetical protein